MFDQPTKWPPSETMTRSSGSSSAIRWAAGRGSRRPSAASPSGAVPSPASCARAASRSTASRHPLGSEPRAASSADQPLGHDGGVAPDEAADVRVGRGGRDIDLHHAGAGREQLAEAHRELVERGSEDDSHVGFADELHRAGRAEAAGDPQVVAGIGEHSTTESRRRGESARRLGEGTELGTRVGEPRAASGEQERATRSAECGREVGDRARVEVRVRSHRGGEPRFESLRHRPHLDSRDVVGDREHRGNAVGEGVLDRDHGGRRGVHPSDRVGAGADRGGERDLVDAPRPWTRGRLVADDEHERHVRLHGLGQGGERVGEAGAVRRGRRGEAAPGAVMGVGGDDGARLVAHRREARRSLGLEGVEEVGVAVAHHAEDVVDVARQSDGDVGGDGRHTTADDIRAPPPPGRGAAPRA